MPAAEAITGGGRPPAVTGPGDIGGSGAGYGSARANAYKSTAGYRQAVAQVVAHQAPHQQYAIARGALSNPTPEGRIALQTLARVNPLIAEKARSDLGKAGPNLLSNAIPDLISLGQQGANALLNPGQSHLPGTMEAGFGGGGGRLLNTAVQAALDVGKAAYNDPIGTTAKTARGLGELGIGTGAAILGAPIQAVSDVAAGRVPLVSTVKNFAVKEGQSLSQRYGPIYNAQNDKQLAAANKAFTQRVQQQGAANEIADAAVLVGGADATLGKTFGNLGRHFTAEDSFFNRPRPDLRISGQEARPQSLSHNLGRMAAQRAEDALRARFGVGGGTNLVRPGEVPTLTHGTFFGEGAKKFISGQQAVGRQRMERTLDRLVRRGSQVKYNKLTKTERAAASTLVEGHIPVVPKPGESLAALKTRALDALDRRAQGIRDYRAAHPESLGNHIPDQFRAQIDELHRIEQLKQNIDGWLTPNLHDYLTQHAANSREADLAQPGALLNHETALARVNRPLMESFGYRHPDESFEDFQRASRKVDKMAVRDSRSDLREHTATVNKLKTRLALATRARDAAIRSMPKRGFVPVDRAIADARRAERAAESAVRERERLRDKALHDHDVLMAQQKALRGPHRGLKDIQGRPLPKDIAERIDRAQRRLAYAQDRHGAALADLADKRRARAAAEAASSPADLPLSAAQADRAWKYIHAHEDRVDQARSALAKANQDLKDTREYNRTAEDNIKASRKKGGTRADQIRLNAYLKTRDEQLHEYNALADTLRQEHGLPPAAFFKHNVHPKIGDAAYAANNGARAMSRPAHTTFEAWRSGVVDRSAKVMFDSLAHQIKGGHQWQLVSDLFSRNHLPLPSASEIHAAGFPGKTWHDLTGFQIAHVMAHMGLDLSKIRFLNPGWLRESVIHGIPGEAAGAEFHDGEPLSKSVGAHVTSELAANERLANALQQDAAHKTLGGVQDLRDLPENDPFRVSKGWMPFTKAAYDEINGSVKPTPAASRFFGKIGQAQTTTILGANPAFVQFNTIAHALLAAFGTRGMLATDAMKAFRWWKGLDQAQRDRVDEVAGGRGVYRLDRVGSEDLTGFRKFMDHLAESRVGRAWHNYNPVHGMFHLEDLQSRAFRRIVFYSEAKRLAFHNMTEHASLAEKAAVRLAHALTVGPEPELLKIVNSLPLAEQVGRHVIDALGDYSRFTRAERTWLNNKLVLFYSFIRHVTRTLLYVLPVKHPIATGLVAQLGELHNQELQDLFHKRGGPNAEPAPWDYGRIMWDNNGHPTSIDFTRALPIGGPLVDFVNQGPAGLASLIQPVAAPILNLIYGHTPQGQPFPPNLSSIVSSYANMSAPYRVFSTLHFDNKEQDADSIPFLHERPHNPKTAAAQAYTAAKNAASGNGIDRALSELFPVPRHDDSIVVAAHHGQKGKRSPRGSAGSWGGGSSSAGSWGGGASSTGAGGWG